jgi:hypothetical protein
MIRLVTDTMKTPFKIYKAIKDALEEPDLLYSYVLNKK